jgi:hypothetical protein
MQAGVMPAVGTPDSNGAFTITAVNNADPTQSTSVTVQVNMYNNDSQPPTFSTVLPDNGSSVSNSVNLLAVGNDDHGPTTKIEVYVDGTLVQSIPCGRDNTRITQCTLDTTYKATNGTHVATYKAYDQAGNVGNSQTSFTVGGGKGKPVR